MIYQASKIQGDHLESFSSLSAAKLLVAYNDDRTKILIRGGVIANVAAGKNEVATLTNNGAVTVNADGDFVFDGSNYLQFDGTGWENAQADSWTMDFCFSDIGTGRNDFCGPTENYQPQIYYNNGLIAPYPINEYGTMVEANQLFLYTVQRDFATRVTTTWLNGNRIKSAAVDWPLGWSSTALGYTIGRSLHSSAAAHKMRYFRAVNGCYYDPNKNFTPNMTGF